MNHIYQPSESSFVGIDKYCEDIKLLLQRSPLVGIWGMGGVGKTTIAKVVFDKLFSQYDSCYFFENIREESNRNGLNYIGDKILSKLLKDENFHNNTPKTPAFKFAMRRLSSIKVLIVLDDVNSPKQLEHFQQICLGMDSKVIITTRDKHVLACLRNHEIYEVKGLNFEKSLQFFRLNAFNENYPDIGYEKITKELVYYANGLPLALKVLGSFLRCKSKKEWESALAKLKKFPHDDIQKVLRLSYDGLDYLEKQIFLDIACFLKGEHIEHVISLSDSYEFFGHIGIRSLQDKALVTIGHNHRVYMHDLIQKMGWDIVRKESIKNPEESSRLWDREEVYDVLKNNKGTNAIEGIVLNMSKIKDLLLRSDTFKKMTNLRFLEFYSKESCKIYLPEGVESFSDKLRYFHWGWFPLDSLPSTFCAEKLVELRMPHSNIAKLWDGLQDVVNLKEIDLTGCHRLRELPDLSNASKLERVDLSSCINLCHIHPSLLHLDTLVRLCVNRCEKLTSLRSESHLKSLRHLSFEYCSSLKQFSLSAEKVEELCFKGTAIDMVPSSIGCCRNLKWLDFYDPPKKVSSKISESTSVIVLNIRDGSKFDSSALHATSEAFPSLKELSLISCVELFQLPDNISVLSSLTKLELNEGNVESLPTSIKHLPCLMHLDVRHSWRLRSLPELPPSLITLKANSCPVLETLIPSTALQLCNVWNCVKLNQQSLNGIKAAAHYRIKQALSTDVYWSGDTIPEWFSYRTTKSWISIELPPRSDLLGFAFCLTASCFIPNFKCECYLEDSGTEYVGNCTAYYPSLYADEVCLWNNRRILDSLNAMERRAYGQVLFRLTSDCFPDSEEMIKFGVWPIYASANKSKTLSFELEADEQKQLSQTKKLKRFPPGLELVLNTESCTDLDTQEKILIDKNMLREFVFQPLPTESQMLNDNIEAFDFFTDVSESELGDKFKRCGCESEGDEQQLPSLTKFKESTLQPVPIGLELELNTKSYTYLEIKGNQVGGSDHENHFCTMKGIEGI